MCPGFLRDAKSSGNCGVAEGTRLEEVCSYDAISNSEAMQMNYTTWKFSSKYCRIQCVGTHMHSLSGLTAIKSNLLHSNKQLPTGEIMNQLAIHS